MIEDELLEEIEETMPDLGKPPPPRFSWYEEMRQPKQNPIHGMR